MRRKIAGMIATIVALLRSCEALYRHPTRSFTPHESKKHVFCHERVCTMGGKAAPNREAGYLREKLRFMPCFGDSGLENRPKAPFLIKKASPHNGATGTFRNLVILSYLLVSRLTVRMLTVILGLSTGRREKLTTSVIYEPAGRAREYGALAANLYAGCAHFCSYCYAPSAVRKDRVVFHRDAAPRADIMERFAKDCRALRGTGAAPVLLSFTTDPYQPIDVEHQLTRQAIQLLHENGLAVELLTKGGQRAVRDFDLLGPADAFATTMTLLDPGDSRQWEPSAALPAERMDAMWLAHSKGIRTWASLEPVLDPAQSLEIIRQTHQYVDLYKVGMLNHYPLAKTIDWPKFGRAAVDLLECLGKAYYIKRDLREHIPEIQVKDGRTTATRRTLPQIAIAQGALL